MIISCKKYQFTLPPDPENRNYFSDDAKTLISEIDLADYLLKDGLGKISYANSKIDESNAQYYETGTVDLKLSNTNTGWGSLGEYINSDKLTDFFELNNFTEQFVFYVEIRQVEGDRILFTGVIRKDGISFTDRANEILNIMALGLEKEFADYYSNLPLVPFGDLPVENMNFTLDGLQFANLGWVFIKNLSNVQFAFGSDPVVTKYRVANRGYFYAPFTKVLLTDTLSLMSGYEQFYLDSLSRFSFFNSVCLGMGWRWFFRYGLLYITDRYDTTQATISLDYETEFMQHSSSIKVDNVRRQVAVYGGEIYGARNQIVDTVSHVVNNQMVPSPFNQAAYYYLGGHTWKIYKDGYTAGNYNLPYSDLKRIGSIYNILHNGENITVADRAEEKGGQEGKLTMKKIKNVRYQWDALADIETFSFPDNETVYLKPYCVSGNNGFHLDLTQASSTNNQFYGNGNAYNAAQDAGLNGMYSRGTPATCMLKYDTATGKYEDYYYYTRTFRFENNMKTYTGGSDKLMIKCLLNGTGDGVYSLVGNRYTIENYPYENIGGIVFTAEEIEIDLINNVTTLNLMSNG